MKLQLQITDSLHIFERKQDDTWKKQLELIRSIHNVLGKLGHFEFSTPSQF